MTSPNPAWRAGAAILGVALCTVAPWAQPGPDPVAPLRTTPTEQITVKVAFRDWGPPTVAGTTILGGNSSNRGGLFAVDTLSGKVRWSFRPTGTAHGNPFVATAPAVSGDSVIVPLGNTLMAVSLATGKELWRGPATAQGATVAVDAGIAYVLGADSSFHALDAATGHEKWKMPFTRDSCESVPVVREGTVYVSGNILVKPGDANSPASYYRHLFALDAGTGQERWRSPSAPLPRTSGVCLRHPLVTADTYFAVSDEALHAVTLATGRERWAPVETRRMMDGRLRPVEVFALVDAGSALVGLTKTALMAFDKASGATAWEVPGQYHPNSPSMAVAGRVLYVQGHPGAPPADEVQGRIVYSGGKPVPTAPALPPGTLRGLDLDTRAILWSFSRPTAEANWPFGFVTPVDGGLWVDSYQALVKLQ
ncbi:MAG: PQQ-binding-like beta-propeller repeat protein [Vicinamibacterales bacterium]